MASEEVHDIVIVGGGICGLALSLGLHRKGIKSLVLERSKYLRAEGAAIIVHSNGWRALDQLNVGTDLRNVSVPLAEKRFEDITKEDNVKRKPYGSEVRCLRRKDVIETLGKHIPAEQIRFGCHVSSVDFDSKTNLHVVTTKDGTMIKSKVLIGCDGSYSVISKALNLAPPKFFPIWTTRGLTTYPQGHDFGNKFLSLTTSNGTLFGCLPIDDKTIHFFVDHLVKDTAGDMNEPKFIRQYTTELLKETPNKITDVVKNCDVDKLSMKRNGYRSLWSIFKQDFRTGTLTVAGDAMHQMGPYLGQGGSAALEDAIVLTRCLSNAIKAPTDTSHDKKRVERVGYALDLYINERRPRLMKLAFQTYLVGTRLSTKSWIAKFVVNFLVGAFFRGNKWDHHELFDCGTI